jgi:hypothetical protein
MIYFYQERKLDKLQLASGARIFLDRYPTELKKK